MNVDSVTSEAIRRFRRKFPSRQLVTVLRARIENTDVTVTEMQPGDPEQRRFRVKIFNRSEIIDRKWETQTDDQVIRVDG